MGQGCILRTTRLGAGPGEYCQWVERTPHVHNFPGPPNHRWGKGAILVLETGGLVAFFARRGLEMSQFPWSEPLEKLQGVKERVLLPEIKTATLTALPASPYESRCLRGTAGSRSLITQTHVHAHTHTHTHMCVHIHHPPAQSFVLLGA